MYAPGSRLAGRYLLQERIGTGGMGEVWRGVDEVLGRTVAVKVMLPAYLSQPGFAERFLGEARTLASINHPGVVDVYDYHSDESTAFLVMEYVTGEALSATLARVGRLTAGRTMALVAQAADALQAAHDRGVIHRDVKPGNLLVRPDGTLVLTDFGIARSELVGHLTTAGMVLGTATYLSPEQATGQTVLPASDVYSLGVVAYQCLAGRPPFDGGTAVEIAMRHSREPPPPLPPDVPEAVAGVVMRALAKDPADRWPSAAAFAAAARWAAVTFAPVTGHGAGVTGTGGPGAAVPPTGYRAGVASVSARPAPYPTGLETPPPRAVPARDRPSGAVVTAVALTVVAVLLCAGLGGYLARLLIEGEDLADLLPTFTSVAYLEGRPTT